MNALGAVLMVAVFASTGGVTGAEIGITAGAAVLAQRLLEAVFGDDAVRRLTREAHEHLAERVQRLLAEESARFTVQLDASGAAGQDGADLRSAALTVRCASPTGRRLVAHGRPAGGRGSLRGAGAARGPASEPSRRAPDRPLVEAGGGDR